MKRAACVCAVSLTGLVISHAAQPIPKAVPARPTHPLATPVPMLTQEHQTAQQLYAVALKDFSTGNLESAKIGFQKVLAISAENPPALINLALIAQRQEHGEDADKFLRRVIQKDTANATAWLLLGIGAYERNELEAAHAISRRPFSTPRRTPARTSTSARPSPGAAGTAPARRSFAAPSISIRNPPTPTTISRPSTWSASHPRWNSQDATTSAPSNSAHRPTRSSPIGSAGEHRRRHQSDSPPSLPIPRLSVFSSSVCPSSRQRIRRRDAAGVGLCPVACQELLPDPISYLLYLLFRGRPVGGGCGIERLLRN